MNKGAALLILMLLMGGMVEGNNAGDHNALTKYTTLLSPNRNIEYLLSENNRIERALRERFTPGIPSEDELAKSEAGLWLKFPLTFGNPKVDQLVLEFGNYYPEPPNVYLTQGFLERSNTTADRWVQINAWYTRTTGENTLAVLHGERGQDYYVYIYFPEARRFKPTMLFMSKEIFWARKNVVFLPNLLLIGFFLALFLYHLFLLIHAPSKQGLWYVLLLAGYSLYLISGLSYLLYLWLPESFSWFTKRADILGIGLGLISLLQYVRNTFSPEKRIHRILWKIPIIWCSVVLSVFLLLPGLPLLDSLSNLTQVITFGTLLAIFMVLTVRKKENARYFLSAWILFFVSTIALQFYSLFNMNPVPTWLERLAGFSSALPMILIAIPLGKRITSLEKEKQLIELKHEQLEEINTLRNQFFAHMAHEIKTPLTLISAPLSDGLRGRWGKDIPIDHPGLKTVQANADYLSRSFNNILRYFEYTEKTFPRKPFRIEPKSAIDQLIPQFEYAARQQNISLKLMDHRSEPSYLLFDRQEWNLVMINLIGNAVRYSEPEGRISITLMEEEKTTRITIENTGIGIDKEALEEIFQPFYQARPSQSIQGGTGLGLPLVKRIMEDNHIPFKFSSVEGKSTLVSMQFPNADLPTGRESESETLLLSGEQIPAPDAAGRRKKILLLEDNIDLRNYLEQHLSENYQVESVPSGVDAQKRIQSGFCPDLILSDVAMPEVNGFEFNAWAAKHPVIATVPFLFITAIEEKEVLGQIQDTRPVDILPKPFDPIILDNKLRSLLHAHDLLLDQQKNSFEKIKMENLETRVNEFKLTKREKELLELFLAGKSIEQCAEFLGISPKTVQRHRDNLYTKTLVSSRHELFALFNE